MAWLPGIPRLGLVRAAGLLDMLRLQTGQAKAYSYRRSIVSIIEGKWPNRRKNPNSDGVPDFAEARVIGVARDALSGYLANSADRGGAMIYFPTNWRAANNDSILLRVSGSRQAARQRIVAALDGIAPSILT